MIYANQCFSHVRFDGVDVSPGPNFDRIFFVYDTRWSDHFVVTTLVGQLLQQLRLRQGSCHAYVLASFKSNLKIHEKVI